jgi:hypothetical protein
MVALILFSGGKAGQFLEKERSLLIFAAAERHSPPERAAAERQET